VLTPFGDEPLQRGLSALAGGLMQDLPSR